MSKKTYVQRLFFLDENKDSYVDFKILNFLFNKADILDIHEAL